VSGDWGATPLAAGLLEQAARRNGGPRSARAVAAVMHQVSDALGNTPAACRASYIDPRLVDAFPDGAPLRQIARFG
jgi:DNA topoisomerase I